MTIRYPERFDYCPYCDEQLAETHRKTKTESELILLRCPNCGVAFRLEIYRRQTVRHHE